MGRIKKKGSIGSLSGTVNDVVLSEWNGIPVVRSRAKESNKPATSGQQEQRAKMATAVKFAVAVKKVFRLSPSDPPHSPKSAPVLISTLIVPLPNNKDKNEPYAKESRNCNGF